MSTKELRFWKSFIGDGIGIWRGSKRAFETFVKRLNKETNKHGINFPIADIQYGKSINFFIDESNLIKFQGCTKPTDAKHYLVPQSFHPKNVFTSVPFSQMIRAIERNSCAENEILEMEELVKDL